ncbi:hypothetical protein MCI89_24705 [Muricomes sp. OA1]|uniref:hypothetical protein n=1 Tax=Muricomes sp. OA1 TaxID=2914165 RepID=UPI001F054D01|nr:hypothetical protein [Muricomes sp. OA1]MCH1975541.1 hypothetical protein [Muricomes sp. OA1]
MIWEPSFKRTNTDEAVGTYTDVLTADYEANTNYDVTVAKGDLKLRRLPSKVLNLRPPVEAGRNGSARSAAAE